MNNDGEHDITWIKNSVIVNRCIARVDEFANCSQAITAHHASNNVYQVKWTLQAEFSLPDGSPSIDRDRSEALRRVTRQIHYEIYGGIQREIYRLDCALWDRDLDKCREIACRIRRMVTYE